MKRRRLSMALAAIASVMVTIPVRADPLEKVRLAYTLAPDVKTCPGESAFQSAVGAIVGELPFDAEAKGELSVRVRREGAKVWATLVLTDASGTNHPTDDVDAPIARCDTLLREAAFAAVMLLQPIVPASVVSPPGGLTMPPQSCPAQLPLVWETPQSTASPEASATPPSSSTLSATPPLRLLASAGVGGTWGSTPGLAGSLSFGLGIGGRSLSIGLEGRLDGFGDKVQDSRNGRTIESRAISGFLMPCAQVELTTRFALGFCALVGGTARSDAAIGEKLSTSQSVGISFAAGLRLGFVARATDFLAFRIHTDGLVVPVPSVMSVENRTLWESPPVVISAQLAAILNFDLR